MEPMMVHGIARTRDERREMVLISRQSRAPESSISIAIHINAPVVSANASAFFEHCP